MVIFDCAKPWQNPKKGAVYAIRKAFEEEERERKKKDQDLERHLRKVAREDKKLRKGGKKTKEINEVIIKMQSLHFRCKDCNKNVHDCSC